LRDTDSAREWQYRAKWGRGAERLAKPSIRCRTGQRTSRAGTDFEKLARVHGINEQFFGSMRAAFKHVIHRQPMM
jgi:hypothetical protein